MHEEIATLYPGVSGVLIAGDMNIHHKRWLRFSNANSQIGIDRKNTCDYFGLWQCVHESTRNEYLLDLVLTDIQKTAICVLPYIADHKGVLIKLPCQEILESTFEREVWHLAGADWTGLQTELENTDWQALSQGSAEDALGIFQEMLWLQLVRPIPRRKIKVTKRFTKIA